MVTMMPTVYPAASPGSPRLRHRLFHRLDRELRGERVGHLHLSQDQITQVCHQKVLSHISRHRILDAHTQRTQNLLNAQVSQDMRPRGLNGFIFGLAVSLA
jgi:hypothetical protein